MTERPDLDAPAMLAVLRAHGVDFVVVGGYAANLHGAARVTTDLDACPAIDLENLGRLAAALRRCASWTPESEWTSCLKGCPSIPRPRRYRA